MSVQAALVVQRDLVVDIAKAGVASARLRTEPSLYIDVIPV